MISQALALALAASIYPPAVAAVIALGRGAEIRWRVAAFVLGAAITTYAVGILILVVLINLGVTGAHEQTPSAALDLVLGVLLIALAFVLHVKRPKPTTRSGPSKLTRYLESRRLAFVLGVTLYVLPSPIYIAAVKMIADAKLSSSGELLWLAATVAVMLWLIELPMLMLLAVPDRAASALERLNLWFTSHGRALAVIVAAGAGLYLALRGLIDLIG